MKTGEPQAPPLESTRLSRCMRSGKDVPLDPPRCVEPTFYCKHRTACPIHLLEKEASRAGR